MLNSNQKLISLEKLMGAYGFFQIWLFLQTSGLGRRSDKWTQIFFWFSLIFNFFFIELRERKKNEIKNNFCPKANFTDPIKPMQNYRYIKIFKILITTFVLQLALLNFFLNSLHVTLQRLLNLLNLKIFESCNHIN